MDTAQMMTAPAPASIKYGVAVGIAQGYRRQSEKQESGQKHEADRQDRFKLPIDAYRAQVEILFRG